jgi:hypothetical protein
VGLLSLLLTHSQGLLGLLAEALKRIHRSSSTVGHACRPGQPRLDRHSGPSENGRRWQPKVRLAASAMAPAVDRLPALWGERVAGGTVPKGISQDGPHPSRPENLGDLVGRHFVRWTDPRTEGNGSSAPADRGYLNWRGSRERLGPWAPSQSHSISSWIQSVAVHHRPSVLLPKC